MLSGAGSSAAHNRLEVPYQFARTEGLGRDQHDVGQPRADPFGITRTNSLTTSEGQPVSRLPDVMYGDGSATRTVTSTGFNDEVRTHSTTATPEPMPAP